MRFVIRDSEAGNEIKECDSLKEAKKILGEYEQTDREENTYTEGFYEIYDRENEEIIELQEVNIIFNYKEFKKEMSKRGHEVHKNGKYLTIIPNNSYEGYSKGFLFATDVIKGFEYGLKFITMDHYNTWIYSAKFKIV